VPHLRRIEKLLRAWEEGKRKKEEGKFLRLSVSPPLSPSSLNLVKVKKQLEHLENVSVAAFLAVL
jgi:hypothetical protein